MYLIFILPFVVVTSTLTDFLLYYNIKVHLNEKCILLKLECKKLKEKVVLLNNLYIGYDKLIRKTYIRKFLLWTFTWNFYLNAIFLTKTYTIALFYFILISL